MKVKQGDIFTLKVVNEKISVGQILQKNKNDIYIVIFATLHEPNSDFAQNLKTLIDDTPAIIGRTSELFFSFTRWRVIGNCAINTNMCVYPNYKIETLQGVFITTFNLQTIRKATENEKEFYSFHSQVSPTYIVSAVKAYHGLVEMDNDYLRLTYDYVKKRSNRLN